VKVCEETRGYVEVRNQNRNKKKKKKREPENTIKSTIKGLLENEKSNVGDAFLNF